MGSLSPFALASVRWPGGSPSSKRALCLEKLGISLHHLGTVFGDKSAHLKSREPQASRGTVQVWFQGSAGPLRSGVRHRDPGPGPSSLWAMSHSRRGPLGPELYVTPPQATGFVSLLGPETNHLGKFMPCSFCSHLGTTSGHHTGRCPNRKRQDPLTPPGTRLPVGCLPGLCHPHFSVQAVGVDTLDGWTGGPGEELQDGTP